MLQSVEPTRPTDGDAALAARDAAASGSEDPDCSPESSRAGWGSLVLRLAVVLAVSAVVVWLVLRTWTHASPSVKSAVETVAQRRLVRVTQPELSQDSLITLPANIDAYQSTHLYSRVSGYLLRWHFDIGDRVTQGQALAEIDTPEMDQELDQARASLIQGRADLAMAVAELQESQAKLKQGQAEIAGAQAALAFSLSVMKRNEQLSESRVISAQDLDENRRDRDMRQAELDSVEAQYKTREATVATAQAKIQSREATVSSLEANVRRLERHQEFKTIRAPFDGVVTRRRAEVGMLVAAGNASDSQELFAVAQAERLRIRVNVPQAMARAVEIGQEAQVLVPEMPNQKFTAKVTRSARAIDTQSRTLALELELANADHTLLPGTYAQVALPVRRLEAVYMVPAAVLLGRPDGLKVAVVDGQDTVHLRSVKLGRDYGRNVEILSGIRGHERLVLNPADDLADGEQVSVAAAATESPPPTKAAH